MIKQCIRAGVIGILGWGLVGCTTLIYYPVTSDNIYVASQDQVWQALEKFAQLKKWPIEKSGRTDGILSTGILSVSADEIRQISGIYHDDPRYAPSEGRYWLEFRLGPKDPGRTRVTARTVIEAYFPHHQQWREMASNGNLEHEIFTFLYTELGQDKIVRDRI